MTEVESSKSASTPAPGLPPFPDMVWIPGGTYRMGSEQHYPEERPVRRVSVDGFWMDRTPVTNTAFEQFVVQRHISRSPRSLRMRPTTLARNQRC
jgi:formylglycine-generating enzyme